MQPRKVIICVALLAALMARGCTEESSTSQVVPETDYEGTIVAVGDSLTEGLGVMEESAYPAVLETKLHDRGYRYRVVNAGISGETSSGTLSRIRWVLTLKPDIVILVIGANDGFRGIDPALIRANIRRIIQVFKENNVIVVLGGMQIVQNLGADYTTEFEKIYPEVARAEDVIYIPFFLSNVAGDPALNQSDGIHPTPEGYRLIVENMLPYVEAAIAVRRQK